VAAGLGLTMRHNELRHGKFTSRHTWKDANASKSYEMHHMCSLHAAEIHLEKETAWSDKKKGSILTRRAQHCSVLK